ncbi:MAG: glycine--tRNA ligase subunit beta [Sphingomicrobium sp.]
MADFLLEILSEEIPARMQARARNDLSRMFAEELDKAGLTHGAVDVFSTPRRLALIARDLRDETQAMREEVKGPRSSAPPQALEGFLRKTGLSRDQLEDRDGVYFAVIERPGRAAAAVIQDALGRIFSDFPWPKSMRWGTGSTRWVRPLQGIVAILGEEIVPFEIAGVASGAMTLGHRFHHPGPITVNGASDYVEKLRACHVIVDHEERERIVREGAAAAAEAAELKLLCDEGLVVENAGLTEWPVPLLGRFDPEFLDVPREVIVLTMRTNQKYFACLGEDGALAPAFVCTANIDATDGGEAIVEGNRRVLAARLADARFFWEQDLKVPLEEQAKKLSGIVFHEKLGTVADRVERIAIVASDWLPEHIGWPEDKARKMQPLLRKAAELAKADLVTGMVGEFPELQGLMGAYYAESYGLQISEAIRDQYKPAGPSDDLPSHEVGTLLAIADKADALFGFFIHGLRPTGSKDPFALRRAALGIIRLIVENDLRLPLRILFSAFDYERMFTSEGVDYADPTDDLVAFIIDRLKIQQRELGVRHDLIDAVFGLGGEDDLVRLLARVEALQEFVSTDDGRDLHSAYKRAANILKKEDWRGSEGEIARTGEEDPLVGVDDPDLAEVIAAKMSERHERESHVALAGEEAALIAALDSAEPEAAAAIEREDFTAAMAALARLRAPIDAFFDHVTVNDPDAAIRERRLNLLLRFTDAVQRVADFSKIEG